MKGKFSFTTIIVFFVISVGLPCGGFCEDSNSTGNSNTIELIPLEVGNFWVYKYNEYDENDSLTDSDIDTMRISEMKSFNSETWYLIEFENQYRSNRGDGLYYGMMIREGDGLLAWETLKEVFSPSLIFKYPASSGDAWEMNHRGVRPASCIGNDETTVVGGVTYKGCMKYRVVDRRGSTIISWFKPGLGEVKMVDTDRDGSYTEKLLISTNVR